MTRLKFRRRIYGNGSRGATGAVQIAMLVSIALYVVAGEMLSRTMAPHPANILFHALSFISISLVGATVVVRRTLVLPSEALLRERPDDSVTVARWRTGYLFLYALLTGAH